MSFPAAPWDPGYQGDVSMAEGSSSSALRILLGAVGLPQGQAAPWSSCPGGATVSHEPLPLPLFLGVVWNPGMGRGAVLHMLVLFNLIWGHSGVFQGPGPVSVCQ